MSNHTKAVAWAVSKIGEHEVPPGSNTGPFVVECQRATDLPGTGWPWCAAAVRRAWQAAGVEVPYRGASAYGLLDYYQRNLPTWVVKRYSDARPGSFVVFNIGSGHVALLKDPILAGAATVTTVGGNESDAVRETTRALGAIRGIVDPPEKTPVPPPHKVKMFEVTTSESGHRVVVYTSGANAISKKIAQILNRRGGVTISRRK